MQIQLFITYNRKIYTLYRLYSGEKFVDSGFVKTCDELSLIAEEKLKKVQSKSQEFKALYERKALELNKLRMQNVHLMNMSASSNGAKYEQNHVDRLYTLLQAEKAQ